MNGDVDLFHGKYVCVSNFGPALFECFYMPGEPALLCEMREREVEGPRSSPENFLYFACTVRVGLWFVAPGEVS